jgi:hypothetical protein
LPFAFSTLPIGYAMGMAHGYGANHHLDANYPCVRGPDNLGS